MTTPQEKATIELPGIVIRRGSLGSIQIGPKLMEIPSEDVTIPLTLTRLDIENIALNVVTSEITKLRASIMATSKTTETTAPAVVKWPEVRKPGESPKKS